MKTRIYAAPAVKGLNHPLLTPRWKATDTECHHIYDIDNNLLMLTIFWLLCVSLLYVWYGFIDNNMQYRI